MTTQTTPGPMERWALDNYITERGHEGCVNFARARFYLRQQDEKQAALIAALTAVVRGAARNPTDNFYAINAAAIDQARAALKLAGAR